MRAVLIATVFIGLIILAGCLQSITGDSMYESYYRTSINRTPMTAPNQGEDCINGACYCLVCRNGTNIFGPLESLIGGSCYFNTNCTAENAAVLLDKNQSPDTTIRHFMIGQGPTFSDFATANTYCSDRLSMAVQWLLATNTTPYMMPDAKRSMCMLGHDVIPVYILYSGGSNINYTQAGIIGNYLGTQGKNIFKLLTGGPVGPVIVVTEMNFNVSQASDVAREVTAIDQGCGNKRPNQINCFVAVAPKLNDYAALDAVMRDLGPTGRSEVDLVAYGIDSHYAHSCDPSRIRLQAINFSSYALYNYSKASIIPYVMFDVGSNDTDNSCTWTEQSVDSAYGSFFPTNMLALQKRGVIGIAPYSFNTTGGIGITNPLNCTDCGVGVNSQRMAWYGGCQQYTYITKGNTGNPSGQTLLIFGNTSGTICNQNANFDYLLNVNFDQRDIMQPSTPTLSNPEPKLFSCDACLIDNLSVSPANLFPSLNAPTSTPPPQYCTAFPEIDQWASARNLDPMLVRAFVLSESNFDPCSAAKVCRSDYIAQDPSCAPASDSSGDSECYNKPGYDEMYYPPGSNCTGTLPIAPDAGQPRPEWRYCAFGLFQNIESPFTFWPSPYYVDKPGYPGPYNDAFNLQGVSKDITAAYGCDTHYNPFNPSDSACLGTLKIQNMLNTAKTLIVQNSQLAASMGGSDQQNLFAAYIAAEMYTGYWGGGGSMRTSGSLCPYTQSNGDCWTSDWLENLRGNATYCASPDSKGDTRRCQNGAPHQDPANGFCYGYTDWFSFMNACEVPNLYSKHDPGQDKIRDYLWLLQCDNNLCPDGRKLYSLACAPDPNNPLVNQLMCNGAGNPKFPKSGVPYIPDQNNTATAGSLPGSLPGGT